MRITITAIAFVAMSLVAIELSYAQTRSTYNRCAELASQQGLSTRSASGRRFINRCLQRTNQRTNYGSSRCPPRDDPWARSAYPSWMCP